MPHTLRSSAGWRGRRFWFFRAAAAAGSLVPPIAAASFFAAAAGAQEAGEADPAELLPAELLVDPPELTLEVGKTAQLTAVVRGEDGNELDRGVVFFSRARRQVGVNPAGLVEAYRPGEHTLVAMVPREAGVLDRRAEAALMVEIPVSVPWPPIERIEIAALPGSLYAGTSLPLDALAEDASGAERRPDFTWASSDPAVAAVSEHGMLTLHGEGAATISASAESARGEAAVTVVPNPAVRLELGADREEVRTGDVVWFEARALDGDGDEVPEYPLQFGVFTRTPDELVAPGAAAFVEPDGAFVAERAGLHTVVVSGGGLTARRTIRATPRNLRKDWEIVGRGPVRDRHTSDLWVWEGLDGRDYAITGTWGADGHAYFWDVTDPASIHLVDTVRVDARTVNDVKVSPDGKFAVISREGASNRKNGLVILDVSNPTDGVRILARYDDQLSGGVHNVFVADEHILALSAGRRYDILNAEDPAAPYRVGRFELDTPGHGIHDVWVQDGIAWSSNWTDGVVAVDIGGGGLGGAPNDPKMIGSFRYPNGWNHAGFPYRSQSTGKMLVFAGDESFPYGFEPDGDLPDRAAGWIHIAEWDDAGEGREVARYQVPEAGSHNLWVEEDILYVGYYNGGLRVVDVSGDLRGDLYRQGREIAFFEPADPDGYKKNAPFVWGPQPFKEHIFFTDWNSGLWAVKLVDPETPRNMGEPQ